jgi:hypothetical protein
VSITDNAIDFVEKERLRSDVVVVALKGIRGVEWSCLRVPKKS